MFNRIKEAVRILGYREPETGADAVFVESVQTSPTPAGKHISHFFEALIAIYGVGYLAGRIGNLIATAAPSQHSVSVGTLIGVLGALLMLVVHWLRADIEQKVRERIHLADMLAPFFGRKLDNVSRVLNS
ncbi:MAG: hypothetical protein ABR921_09885 [Candidatus Sulfotelmatobacter sp.]|jgi:hypothetical protein